MLSLIHDIRFLNPHTCQDMTPDLQTSNLQDPFTVAIQVGKEELRFLANEQRKYDERIREEAAENDAKEAEPEEPPTSTTTTDSPLSSITTQDNEKRKKRAIPVNVGGITMKVEKQCRFLSLSLSLSRSLYNDCFLLVHGFCERGLDLACV